ncbi:hypothetical protein GCM10017767_12640 [Halomonas urumqiensis]|nr:hypothetical protein GCM10017767_12640 [Halomonas urumqiensis]
MLASAGLLGMAGLADAVGQDDLAEMPDWRSAELVFEIEWGEERLDTIAVSPDGLHLAMTAQGQLDVFGMELGEHRHRLSGHLAAGMDMALPVSSLTFSPDGRLLATTSWSQGVSPEASLILWDLATGEARLALAEGQGCHDAAFTPDATALWASCGAGVQRYSLANGEMTSDLGDRPVEAIALHPEGEILASVAANVGPDPEVSQRIVLWGLSRQGANQIGVLEVGASVTDLAFTPDGRHLVAQGQGDEQRQTPRQVTVWDWQRAVIVHRHALLDSTPVAMSPDGTILAGGFRDGLLLALDGTPLEHGILIRQQGGADALAFGPSGEEVVWAGKPPTFPTAVVRLWRTKTANQAPGQTGESDYQVIELPEAGTTDDPVALARELYGLREPNALIEETVTLRRLSGGDSVVTLRLDGLKDDSVRAIRYRLHFTPADEGRWRLDEVGRQQRCRRGGIDPDEWITQLCP